MLRVKRWSPKWSSKVFCRPYSISNSLAQKSEQLIDVDHVCSDQEAKDLFKNVLLVKKTPKYERLKDEEIVKHPYI